MVAAAPDISRTRRSNVVGCVYMVLGSLGTVVNDAFIRSAVDRGLGVYQALFLRATAMTLIFAGAGGVRNEHLTREHFKGPVAVRATAELLAAALFFTGLVRLPFGNAQTLMMTVPFAITLLAAYTLGERVSGAQYAAVAVGFVGVLVVVRPAAGGFSWWSLVVLASGVCLIVREFATRRVDPRTPAVPIALLTAIGVAALTGTLAVIVGWKDITLHAAVLVGLACCSMIVGYVFSIQTVRVGDLSVSAPFRYSSLIGAVIIGRIVFDERVDALAVVGCVLIVAAGVYSAQLDRRRQAN